jgi:tetratricopeptide (TPR) repeat protein
LVEIDPENHDRVWRLGYALAFAGRDDEAVPLIEGVLDKLTGEEVVTASNILGQFYLEKQDLETSSKHFQRSRSLDPNDLHSLVSLATIHQRNGEQELANLYHEEAIRVRNEKTSKDLIEKRYATRSADLKHYFEAGDYANCMFLIEKMKADANATQLGQLQRLEQEIERRK